MTQASAARSNRRYTPAELVSFFDSHERMLDGKPGCRAILHNADARGADLSGRRLIAADLTGIELDAARLVGADLSRARLAMASLRGADARQAVFTEADMRGASVRNANFAGANFDKANLSRASLESDGGQVFRIALSPRGGELIFEVDFAGCSMQRASLVGARLAGANFSDALLGGSDLSGADLTGARLNGAVLTGVNLTGVKVEPGALGQCVRDPDATSIKRASLLIERLASAERWVDSGGREGASCMLDREDLRPLANALRGRRLTAISATRACAVAVSFEGAQLQGGRFDDADLRGADFSGADLRGASFRGAKLRHAIFRDADLGPLPLSGGAARAVDLTSADFAEEAFLDARR